MTQSTTTPKRMPPVQITDMITLTEPGPKRAIGSSQFYKASIGDIEVQNYDSKHDAVEELHTRVEQALTGPYNPVLVYYENFLGTVWRHPCQEYLYRVMDLSSIHPQEGKEMTVRSFGSGDPTLTEAVRRMRSHMAGIIWDHYRHLKEGARDLKEPIARDLIREPADREEFLRRCRWQERYKEIGAKMPQLTDNQIREKLLQEGL